jgi:dihydroflavonol-4-reductase
MKIFLTGATGCVGAHTARELLDAGHEVRLLVRNKKAAEDYFNKFGYLLTDFVVADMLDTEAVKKGMQGCDAVVHAAAIIDLDPSNAEKTKSNNLKGFDSVIGTACELGIPKIIYVSSLSVFFDEASAEVNEESRLCDAKDAYTSSKKMCEEKARNLQKLGFPIITTYPSSIFGPDDPRLSESNSAFLKFINLLVPLTTSGIQYIDVRDLAKSHRLLLEKPLLENREKERYMVTGFFLPWRELANQLEKASGLGIRKVPVPGFVFRGLGHIFDALRRVFPIAFPISVESTKLITSSPVADSSYLLKSIEMQYRTPEETFSDTVSWLRKEKHLDK